MRLDESITNSIDDFSSSLSGWTDRQLDDFSWIDRGSTRIVVPLEPDVFGNHSESQTNYVVKFEPELYSYPSLETSENFNEVKTWEEVVNTQRESLFAPIIGYSENFEWVVMEYYTPVRPSNAPSEKHHTFKVDSSVCNRMRQRFLEHDLYPHDFEQDIGENDGDERLIDYGINALRADSVDK